MMERGKAVLGHEGGSVDGDGPFPFAVILAQD